MIANGFDDKAMEWEKMPKDACCPAVSPGMKRANRKAATDGLGVNVSHHHRRRHHRSRPLPSPSWP